MTEGRTVRDTDGFISFYMYVYAVFRTHGATRRFVAHLVVSTKGCHCRQVHLPLWEYVPRCIQLQLLCEYL